MTSTYADFLERKASLDPPTGISEVGSLPSRMFPHQRDITSWALRRGRAAIFAGTGLGKSLMELAWADAVHLETGKPVLHLAPMAVSAQLEREAVKFNIPAQRVRSQLDCGPGINITNYQKLEHFDVSRFGGVILDESSILKSFNGHYRTRLIEVCDQVPFRLAATATPAPNDFMELGNHAEFLGVMSYTDMLATFFVHDGGDTATWRLKGHAEDAFWKWMATWSVMLRNPGDLGYPNEGYDLPPLNQTQHTVGVKYAPSMETGLLFPIQAATLQERIGARRDTVEVRVAKTVEIVDVGRAALIWCNLNSEQDALEKAFAGQCLSVRGSMTDDQQERAILSWLKGDKPVMISKPSMLGFGLNFQHCNQMVFVGLNDSFEQVYQAIRRCWRFGQTQPVDAHFIAAETEGAVVANLKRKESEAERMAAAMVRHTADLSAKAVRGMVRDRPDYDPQQPFIVPTWLGEAQ